MKQNSFTMKEHLKKNDLIRDVFDKGAPFKCSLTHIYLLKRNTGSHLNRVAFISRKRLHNKKAVLRNRFRRLLREAYRKTKHLLPGGYDIVILGTNLKKHTKSTAIEREITNAFKKIAINK
ncbi:ribonuclease P protein component [Candidatus Omnitrophota bacterium]